MMILQNYKDNTIYFESILSNLNDNRFDYFTNATR